MRRLSSVHYLDCSQLINHENPDGVLDAFWKLLNMTQHSLQHTQLESCSFFIYYIICETVSKQADTNFQIDYLCIISFAGSIVQIYPTPSHEAQRLK